MTKSDPFNFSETNLLNPLINDLLYRPELLKTLMNHEPSLEGIYHTTLEKAKENTDRKLLKARVLHQYQSIELSASVQHNIDVLEDEKTFCVVTAHQLNIFTGPIYYIHKILSTIALAENLNRQYSEFNYIPVFVMGSEDHDLEEINHIHLYGERYEWNTAQRGATGRMLVDEALIDVLGRIKLKLNNEQLLKILDEAYQLGDTLAYAQRKFIHALFGHYGLVIVDLDDEMLKEKLEPIAREEVRTGIAQSVLKPSLDFLEQHYHVQAMPRAINFFKIEEQQRVYIVSEGELNQSTTRDISPNVIYRPLYQQLSLPSVCYVGGGGELAYWLELKPLFEHFKVVYPVLMMRNHCLYIDEKSQQKFIHMGFDKADAFKTLDELKRNFILQHSDVEAHIAQASEQINSAFDQLKMNAVLIDKTMEVSLESDKIKVNNILQQVEQKLIKAEKRKQDDSIAFLEKYKYKLMPNEVLQERFDNFLSYYDKYGFDFFESIVKEFKPFSKEILFLQL